MNKKNLLVEENKIRRLLIFMIVFLLLLIAGGLFFWDRQISNLKVEKTVFELLRRQYQSVEMAKRRIDDIDRIEMLVANSLPKRKHIIDFVQAVERILTVADNVNFNFRSKAPQQKQFLYLPFSLSFRIGSAGFKDFWQQFENLPYFTQVKELKIKTLGGWKGNYDVEMTAWLYISEPFE